MTQQQIYLTVKEVAEILRVRPQTIYIRIKKGELPSRKIGGKILIPSDFIEEQKP